MKVIDLLNKIANGEEVPKKIKIKGYKFKLSDNYKDYNINYVYEDNFDNYWLDMVEINEEIKLIEEDKEIEEVHNDYSLPEMPNDSNTTYLVYRIMKHEDKLNELIKAVNELKKEGK